MDPLSVSASIAGLIALATSIAILSRNICLSLNEDVATKISTLGESMEIFSALLKETEDWVQDIESKNKGVLLTLSPYIQDCENNVKEILKHLEAIKGKSKSKRVKKFLSALSLTDELMKGMETARNDLEKSKLTLILALLSKQREVLQDDLGEIYETIVLANSRGLEVEDLSEPKSFQDWLNRFASDDDDDALVAYKDKNKKRKQRDQSVLGGSSAGNSAVPIPGKSVPCAIASGPRTDNDISSSKPNKIYIKVENLQNKQGEVCCETICVEREARILDVILELHGKGYDSFCGFESLDGLYKFGPFDSWASPIPLRSTTGPSSYDLRGGLKINTGERAIDFFNDFLEYYNPKMESKVSLQLGQAMKRNTNEWNDYMYDIKSPCLTITDPGDPDSQTAIVLRRRTVSSPIGENQCHNEAGRNNHLSQPSHITDPLSLFKTADFGAKLPPAIRKKGGYLAPMLQREALELTFQSMARKEGPLQDEEEAFALKVYAGSINLVTGKEASGDKGDNEQDFVVIPAQLSLKGAQIDAHTARELVAMPMTWGYSLEKQITNSEHIGGIQFEIAPKLNNQVRFMSFYRRIPTEESSDNLDVFEPLPSLGRNAFMIQMLHLKDTKQVAETLYDDSLAYLVHKTDRYENIHRFIDKSYRTRFVHELEFLGNCTRGLQLGAESDYSDESTPLTVRAVNPIPICLMARIYSGCRVEAALKICLGKKPTTTVKAEQKWVSPFLNLKDFRDVLVESSLTLDADILSPLQVFANDRDITLWYRNDEHYPYHPLHDILPIGGIITMNTTDKMHPDEMRPGYPMGLEPRDPAWTMGLGVQSALKQTIKKCTDQRLWRWDKARFVNIQIINAVLFQEVNRVEIKPLQVGREYKPRIRSIKSLKQPVPPPPQATSSDKAQSNLPFLGISDIDHAKSIEIGVKFWKGVEQLGCACCETRFCNIILGPCNHIFCKKCIDTEMTPLPGKIICDFCDGAVTNFKVIGGTMELPKP